jgi:putative membrane protein insertion efficiency factor
MTLAVRVGLIAIRSYQLLLSPFAGGACRFEPSCSKYAEEALRTHGLIRGLWLAVRRVARCHPLARPGIDPVPPAPSARV